METIESRENARFKSAVKVRKGGEPGLVFVEGVRLCEEAIRSGSEIVEAIFSSDFLERADSDELARSASDAARSASLFRNHLFRSLCDTRNPQGIALICRRPTASLETISANISENRTSLPIALLLIEVNNPGNLGAVLRTAEAAGAAGVVTSEGSVDAFSPAVLRGSMGASFRLPVVEKLPYSLAIEWARAGGLRIAVTDSGSGVDHSSADLTPPSLLIFGSEAHGLPESVRISADVGLKIDLENEVESLNLAVSAGILLFEARRQRK